MGVLARSVQPGHRSGWTIEFPTTDLHSPDPSHREDQNVLIEPPSNKWLARQGRCPACGQHLIWKRCRAPPRDLREAGASASNQWFYETGASDAEAWNVKDPNEEAPVLYCSFPSLKDPHHDAGAERPEPDGAEAG